MKRKIVGMIGLPMLAVMIAGCGVEMVDTGYRGVKTHYGKVQQESLPEGLYFYNPISQDFIEMDVRTASHEYETITYTKDIQQAAIKVVLMANLKKDAVHLMYQDYGWYWEEKLLTPSLNGALKTVIGKWDAVDLIANRDKARAEIETMLSESLNSKNVEVIRFELVNVDFADEFEKAVERKVVAIQDAKAEQNRTVQVQEQARQTVIAAESEAKSMRIRADALTQNKALVEYEAVQKWNGILPTMMLGNSTPFIQVK